MPFNLAIKLIFISILLISFPAQGLADGKPKNNPNTPYTYTQIPKGVWAFSPLDGRTKVNYKVCHWTHCYGMTTSGRSVCDHDELGDYPSNIAYSNCEYTGASRIECCLLKNRCLGVFGNLTKASPNRQGICHSGNTCPNTTMEVNQVHVPCEKSKGGPMICCK